MNRVRLLTATIASILVLSGVVPGIGIAASATQAPNDPLVLAHYYIWFDASSWNRAKIDYPALGRYSSDQESTMREHVRMAKQAGIDGFIVSWKSTATLDRRLAQLVAIAEEEDFKLAITYQGLDFNRDPLPTDRISEDLDIFLRDFADSPVFEIFDRPLVSLTGTWNFTTDELDHITKDRSEDLLILATEKDVDGYLRVAPYVDGNLYYWSSVNPETNPGHADKLQRMSAAVRANRGIWIAPVAPGFDARLIDGTIEVPRRDGDTLRAEWQAALSSIPDAIGIISWNEFSENTHVEPSLTYGDTALRVIADLTGSPEPNAIDFDSSAPEGPPTFSFTGAMAGVLFIATLIGSTVYLYRKRSHLRAEAQSTTPERTEPD